MPMEGQDSERDDSRIQDASKRGDSPMLFEFVTNDESRRSQIRSHAMRESWRKRNRGRSNSPATQTPSRAREILPRGKLTRQSSSSTGKEAGIAESDAEMMDEDVTRESGYISSGGDESVHTVKRKKLLILEGAFLDPRHTLAPTSEASVSSTQWSLSSIPKASGIEHNPYQSLGSGDFDPFNNIKLSQEDKALLHHWAHNYAPQAFGSPSDPIFDPLQNIYVALNLAQPGEIHASLAHSASHIAYLRQERSNSIQAITHKMAAIKMINQSLDDPVKAISDETFSAVCRLLTFERYWGTEAAWKLHRRGLIQMIKNRGGLSTFQSNWELELRIHLISLMPKPRWNNPVFESSGQPSEIPSASDNSFDVLLDYEILHSNFVSFFAELTTVRREAADQYPAINTAVTFLRSTLNHPGEKVARLTCLFYIAVIFKHAERSHFDLSWLNDSLVMTEHIWRDSVETLRWLLLHGMGRGPRIPVSLARTEKLAEVATLLKESSWRRMEDRNSKILLEGSPAGIENAPWNSNMFEDDSDDD